MADPAPQRQPRLGPEQLQAIREEARRAFGAAVRVLLFGSRARPDRRGGDIDLWVETDLPADEALQAADRLWAALQRRLGEQRIDIVLHRRGRPLRPVDRTALAEGIQLLGPRQGDRGPEPGEAGG